MGKPNFEKLLEPYHIGRVQTRNRMIKTAAGVFFFNPGLPRVNETAKAFYEALARGGVGLIIVEGPALEYPLSDTNDRRIRLDDDKYIKDVSQLTEVIHKHGCPAFVQFQHRGPWGRIHPDAPQPVAASSIAVSSEFDIHEPDPPRTLTIPEIEELVDRWASVAVRAAKAGFDGVEVHTGCDHLLPTFISRFWNKRNDDYGPQNLENRTRFTVSIIREIKKRLGQDFPVTALMNVFEIGGGDEGMTFEEGKAVAKILVEAGVDALHARSHWIGQHIGSFHHEVLFYPEPYVPIESFPKELDWSRKGPLANVPVAAFLKKIVSVPIMTVGGFVNPLLGEQVLREGKADFIGMTRALFADPELPNKVASGRLDDIAPCTHCGECLRKVGEPRRCRINSAFGTTQYEIKKAKKVKRVVVVGGGPSGMQAARIAAMRGHEVTLYDKAHKLGGALPMAALVKGFDIEDVPGLIRFLEGQVIKAGVNVRLGQEFNPEVAKELKPDVVILATGGLPAVPKIPGIDRRNVVSNVQLHNMLKAYLRFLGPKTLRQLTNVWMPLGKRVVIIGGGIQGCQLAEFLTKRGRKVTIVDTAETLGEELVPERKNRLFRWFRQKGVTLMPGVKYEEITDKGLTVTTKEGKKVTIEADSVLPALSLTTNSELLKGLKDKVPEVYAIGDCDKPALIPDATAAGWKVANAI